MLAPPPLPRTLEASLRDLASASPQARRSAVEDLVRHALRDPSVRARAIPLFQHALQDDVAGVRAQAAIALADLHASEALPPLLVAIEDEDAYVRQMALSALGEIKDPRAAPRLARALQDPRPEVRYQSIIAYARVEPDPTEALRALTQATRDEDDSVRYIALRIVEERVDAGERDGLGALTTRARAILKEEPRHVAVVAAILLAKLGDDTAKDLLLRVVDGTFRLPRGPAQEDEREAVELTGVLGMKEAIPALERRAFGLKPLLTDTAAYAATIALARLGHARARAKLMDDLRSRKRSTREAAVVAVGRARMEEARPVVAGLTGNDADPDLIAETLAALDAGCSSPSAAPSSSEQP